MPLFLLGLLLLLGRDIGWDFCGDCNEVSCRGGPDVGIVMRLEVLALEVKEGNRGFGPAKRNEGN